MAHTPVGAPKDTSRRRLRLREQNDRNSLARQLQIPRGASWETIALAALRDESSDFEDDDQDFDRDFDQEYYGRYFGQHHLSEQNVEMDTFDDEFVEHDIFPYFNY